MVRRRGGILALVAVLVMSGGIYLWHSSGLPLSQVAGAPVAGPPSTDRIVAIDVARLKAERPEVILGRRDLFIFQPTPSPAPPPGEVAATVGPTTPPTPPPPTSTPPPPPLPLKYIGVLEVQKRPKIAIILTEQKEILHGLEGDLLAGRYRIVKIGLESVDMQDVSTGYSQRIPLRGN